MTTRTYPLFPYTTLFRSGRSAHLGARPLRVVDDLARRLVEDAMIERLQAYADILALHFTLSPGKRAAFIPKAVPQPLLQASTVPSVLFDDGGDDAGADGTAAFANGEAQPLVHRDRRAQRHFHRHVVARHPHLGTLRQRPQ